MRFLLVLVTSWDLVTVFVILAGVSIAGGAGGLRNDRHTSREPGGSSAVVLYVVLYNVAQMSPRNLRTVRRAGGNLHVQNRDRGSLMAATVSTVRSMAQLAHAGDSPDCGWEAETDGSRAPDA